MVRAFSPALLCSLLFLASSPVWADAPPDGNYQLSFVLQGSVELNYWLIKIETKDGKLAGSVADIANQARGSTLKTVSADDKHVRITFNTPRGELVFQGQLPLVKKTLRGTMDWFGQACPATIKETKLAPGAALRQLTVPNLDTAGKVDEHLDSLGLFAAVIGMAKSAKAKKVSAEDLRRVIDKADKTAASYGPRWHNEFGSELAGILATQKEYAAIALALATRLEKQLDAKASTDQQVKLLKVLASAQGTAGKAEAAKKTLARLNKLELILDQEYFKTVPPFKAEKFAGRKGKSNRTVVFELFTGAQCPPCVAADVAFDVLQKTYKPADLVLIQYHMHIPGPDPLTNADNEARARYYGIGGTPSTFFNGKAKAGGGGFMPHARGKYEQYCKVIDPELESDAGAKIAAFAARKGNKIDIHVEVSELAKPGDDMRLRLVLVEESIRYVGGNKLRFHHQVARTMPGGVKGFALKEKSSKHTVSLDLDELRRSLTSYLDNSAKRRPFPNSDRPLDFKHLRLVAFVQDDATKEILQGTQVEIAGEEKGAANPVTAPQSQRP